MKQIGLKLVLHVNPRGPIGMVGLNHQYLQNAFLLLLLFSIALASGNLIVGNIEIKEKEKTNSLSEGLYCR